MDSPICHDTLRAAHRSRCSGGYAAARHAAGNKRQQTFFSDLGRRFQWGLLDRNNRRKVSTRSDWADALRDPLIEADEMGRSGERRKAAVRWAWTRSWKGP